MHSVSPNVFIASCEYWDGDVSDWLWCVSLNDVIRGFLFEVGAIPGQITLATRSSQSLHLGVNAAATMSFVVE